MRFKYETEKNNNRYEGNRKLFRLIENEASNVFGCIIIEAFRKCCSGFHVSLTDSSRRRSLKLYALSVQNGDKPILDKLLKVDGRNANLLYPTATATAVQNRSPAKVEQIQSFCIDETNPKSDRVPRLISSSPF